MIAVIFIIVAFIAIVLTRIAFTIYEIYSVLCDIDVDLDKMNNPWAYSKGKVADPFETARKRGLEPTTASKHVIKPKSPDQIRAEHYEEIKNGAKYGWADNN